MPIEDLGGGFRIPDFLGNAPLTLGAAFGVKAFFVLFLVFYMIFALIIYRQIQLMARTLPTPLVPLLKFLAIIHIGVSVAIFLMVLGTF